MHSLGNSEYNLKHTEISQKADYRNTKAYYYNFMFYTAFSTQGHAFCVFKKKL